MTPVIAIIIPSYNEGFILRKVVSEIITKKKYTLIIVDDGSSTPAEKLIGDIPVTIIRHSVNLGQGAALQTGIEYALYLGATYLVTFDADGQHTTSDIPSMLLPLQNNEADITLASRFLKPGNHNASLLKKWILKTACLINYFFTGLYLTDAHNGLRAMTRNAAEKINIKENRMAHATEILFSIKKNKLRFREVPATVIYTDYSKKKGQSIFNSIRIFLDLVLHKIFE
jgi:glycosyltransferase involved in cell wall biosynthesis